jgi:glycosyltransferase involved in cell wall biosynthesis
MISVIGTVGVPACYGGFESLVENLIPSKKIVLIYCSKISYKEHHDYYKKTKLQFIPLNANGMQSIPYDICSILHSLFLTKNDLLVLGVSGAIALPLFKLLSRRKVITNIDGLEWKRAKWGRFAKWFLKLSERVAVRFSDVVIADNASIAEYVKSFYGLDTKVIAYGGEHAIKGDIPESKQDYALALCRIEPENNVEMILDAFSKSKNQKIKFIGNWHNSEYGKMLKSKFHNFSNIELIDPIYDLKKLFEIRKYAKIYLHGHSAGGTNPSLVEMMFFDIPILCFDCDYNRASTENKSQYFNNADELAVLLTKELYSNGMKVIAERRYTWKIVKQQYEDLF